MRNTRPGDVTEGWDIERGAFEDAGRCEMRERTPILSIKEKDAPKAESSSPCIAEELECAGSERRVEGRL